MLDLDNFPDTEARLRFKVLDLGVELLLFHRVVFFDRHDVGNVPIKVHLQAIGRQDQVQGLFPGDIFKA